ncbi:methyltransferase GidB [Parvibaculum lavamentivorans DS-1]|uniref:Ribosomal RNA small subunit methyltransferase G n=1 Tax=Parvibaculum lavamentivorans (strain DS-1 / DSM 13023 / NCIMB 13966) TaxID=402881 RepID=RSMG_PARL1|nr:16S rRNA (guanine(527)-N(7))-methyltransferase RsmG [Parvibaculum lavamentivorans]A7HSL2.1 RecName: Full=Ribosomal RNA small subunit methyltransferase G; AltName: Full=16S rRNA 7-methylguanosine methyltransferase; Short=16S rRNA m7G methyltransferase [Parvibaculum lavamentivorans DS-1]ABS62895.1 methyltransferase GidB [Parvibaculum lavamentivorans DS-1]
MTQHIVSGGPQVVDSESFSALTNVSRETLDRLLSYEALLRKWQKSINLVSNGSLPELWRRHMLDSAQLVCLVPESARRWIDLGSGGGFPGLVIAILLRERPGFQMHLVESDQRKCVFMREVARVTGAPATVHTVRIEAFAQGAEAGDVVSARALAPLDRLFGWAAPLFGPETIGLFLKGQGLQDELTLARESWIFDAEFSPSQSDPEGSVLKVRGLHGPDGQPHRR